MLQVSKTPNRKVKVNNHLNVICGYPNVFYFSVFHHTVSSWFALFKGKPSHEPQCQESQKRNDLECSNSDSDEGDLEELTGKSLETIGVTLVIPQHPSQTDSKHDANLLYELFKKASSELAGDGSNTCRYCRQPVWCTLEHMQRRHFRYAIRFESKGISEYSHSYRIWVVYLVS